MKTLLKTRNVILAGLVVVAGTLMASQAEAGIRFGLGRASLAVGVARPVVVAPAYPVAVYRPAVVPVYPTYYPAYDPYLMHSMQHQLIQLQRDRDRLLNSVRIP